MSGNQKSSQDRSQSVTFRYSQEAASEGFNRLLCDILPCGIYKGGELTLPSLEEISSGTSELGVYIEPVVCYIRSNKNNGENFENVAVRYERTEKLLIEVGKNDSSNVDASLCYVVLRCAWENSDIQDSVVDVKVVRKECSPDKQDGILPTDIVLGRVYIKQDANGNYVIDREHYLDTTCRQEVFLKDLEKASEYFKVTVNDTPDNNVIVTGGVLNTTSGYKIIEGTTITVPDIENETDARTDLICITDDWEIHFKIGTPYSYSQNDKFRPYPSYAGVKPIAEIRRAGIRRDVRGGDIVSVFDGTIIGSYANAKDTPVKDIEGLLPTNFSDTSKNVEDVLALLLKSTIALHNNDTLEKADGNTEENTATRGAVYKRNINWGTAESGDEEHGDVYAGVIPVKDVRSDTNPDGRFANSNVEAVLKELAGDGRTTENLKNLSDDISNLNDKVDQNKNDTDDAIENAFQNANSAIQNTNDALNAHINDTVLDNENHTIHGSVSFPTPSTLMQRDEYGKTQVATADENDNEKTVVNKEYVTNVVGDVSGDLSSKKNDKITITADTTDATADSYILGTSSAESVDTNPTTLKKFKLLTLWNYIKGKVAGWFNLAVTESGNTKSVSLAGTATNATNVTTSINGKAITNIFETNGTTVKNATNATHASDAKKLVNASNANLTKGSATRPVYFKDGVPTEIGYSIEKSVPSNAVFTDTNTTYTNFTSDKSGLVPAPTASNTSKFLRGDGTWAEVQTSSHTHDTYVKKAGDTMSGDLTVNGAITASSFNNLVYTKSVYASSGINKLMYLILGECVAPNDTSTYITPNWDMFGHIMFIRHAGHCYSDITFGAHVGYSFSWCVSGWVDSVGHIVNYPTVKIGTIKYKNKYYVAIRFVKPMTDFFLYVNYMHRGNSNVMTLWAERQDGSNSSEITEWQEFDYSQTQREINVNTQFNGSVTATTNLRIPTSQPSNLQNGDIWIS